LWAIAASRSSIKLQLTFAAALSRIEKSARSRPAL
jgi:hypothetical protein